MTEAEINEILEQGGNASRHFLIKISGINSQDIYICNNNEEIIYLNQTYSPSAFEYTPPTLNGGGKLSVISLPYENSTIYEALESAQYNEVVRLDVYDVLICDGQITQLNYYYSTRGSFNMTYRGELELTPVADDRNSMTFPPYTYDTENNKGNA